MYVFIRQSFVIGVKKKKRSRPLNQSETKLDEIVARSTVRHLYFPRFRQSTFLNHIFYRERCFFFRLDASVGQRKNSESPWGPFFMGQRKTLSPHEDFLSSQWLLKVICINFGQFWSTTRKMLDKFFSRNSNCKRCSD